VRQNKAANNNKMATSGVRQLDLSSLSHADWCWSVCQHFKISWGDDYDNDDYDWTARERLCRLKPSLHRQATL